MLPASEQRDLSTTSCDSRFVCGFRALAGVRPSGGAVAGLVVAGGAQILRAGTGGLAGPGGGGATSAFGPQGVRISWRPVGITLGLARTGILLRSLDGDWEAVEETVLDELMCRPRANGRANLPTGAARRHRRAASQSLDTNAGNPAQCQGELCQCFWLEKLKVARTHFFTTTE